MTSLQHTIVTLRSDHPELSNAEIAERVGCQPSYVRAAMQRAGLVRPRIGNREKAEREQDHRDLDLLSDIADGHSEKDVAKFWNVSRRYVRSLKQAATEAA